MMLELSSDAPGILCYEEANGGGAELGPDVIVADEITEEALLVLPQGGDAPAYALTPFIEAHGGPVLTADMVGGVIEATSIYQNSSNGIINLWAEVWNSDNTEQIATVLLFSQNSLGWGCSGSVTIDPSWVGARLLFHASVPGADAFSDPALNGQLAPHVAAVILLNEPDSTLLGFELGNGAVDASDLLVTVTATPTLILDILDIAAAQLGGDLDNRYPSGIEHYTMKR